MINDNLLFYCTDPKIVINTYEMNPDNHKEIKNKTAVKIAVKDFFKYIHMLIRDIKENQQEKIIYGIKARLINDTKTLKSEDLPLENSIQVCIDIGTVVINLCKVPNDDIDLESIEFSSWILTEDNCYARIITNIKLDKIKSVIIIRYEIEKYQQYKKITLKYEFRYVYNQEFNCQSILSEPLFIAIRNIQKINQMISYNIYQNGEENGKIIKYVSFFIPKDKSETKFKAESYVITNGKNIKNGKRENYEIIIKNNKYIKSNIFKKLKSIQDSIKDKYHSYYFTGKENPGQFKLQIEKDDISHLIDKKDEFKIYINTNSFLLYNSLTSKKNKFKNILNSSFCTYIHPYPEKYYITAHNIEYDCDTYNMSYDFSLVNISQSICYKEIDKNTFLLTRISLSYIRKQPDLGLITSDEEIYNYIFSEYKYIIQNFTIDYKFNNLIGR